MNRCVTSRALTGRGIVWAVLAALVALAAPAARAEEPAKPTYVELRAQHDAAREAKSWDRVARLLPEMAEAATRGKDKAEIQDAGSIFRRYLTYGTEAIQVAAIQAIGMLGVPGSSVYLRPFLVGDKSRRRSLASKKAAIEAWARIQDKGAHEILLDLARTPSSKDDDLEIGLVSVAAYRHFKRIPKRDRFVVWRDFLQTYQNVYDSNASWMSGSAQTWWAAMNGPMLETWNQLTGQQLKTLKQCQDWWRDNKERIQRERE